MKDSIIILCGGGPAPGMNTVVCSVAKTFLANGYRFFFTGDIFCMMGCIFPGGDTDDGTKRRGDGIFLHFG